MKNSATHFIKGTRIEVQKPQQYHTATVLKPTNKKCQLYVEYDTLYASLTSKRLKEYVDLANVRPIQPKEDEVSFKVGDAVDVHYEDGWRRGIVMDVYGNNESCLVLFEDGENELEFDGCDVRVHREWDGEDGSWLPGFGYVDDGKLEEKGSEMEMNNENPSFEKNSYKGRPVAKFSKRQIVEVSSDEDGYEASWYAAKILKSLGNDKYLVEYFSLKADDKTNPLKEEAFASHIRPLPPIIRSDHFCTQFEEVDAWYNGGWWRGMISEVLGGDKYVVYFSNTKEEIIFDHCNLRPHLDWENGRWVNFSKITINDPSWKNKKGKAKRTSRPKPQVKFSKGMKIEVKSDEDGFKGSWYAATIEELKDNDIYLVRYDTLVTDEEAEHLKEEADVSRIRPSPPEIVHPNPFTINEPVDAWYNEGWWEGCICKVLKGLRYVVYFITSNEMLEFEHHNLRSHQDWTGGQWIAFAGI